MTDTLDQTTNGASPPATRRRKVADPVPPQEAIEIRPVSRVHIRVPVIGTAPLIISKFSEKARRAMLDAQQNRAVPKEPRDPDKEFHAALYEFAESDDGGAGYGIPAAAFRESTVGAARYYKGVTMKDTRQFLFMRGQYSSKEMLSLVRIRQQDVWETDPPTDPHTGDPLAWPRMREDVVRLAGPSRSADLRYRPEFVFWRATLDVVFVENSISRGSVVNLIEAGGMGVGVGEWRPERRGEFGTYSIDDRFEIEVVED